MNSNVEFRVTRILGRIFSIWIRDVLALTALSVIVQVPLFVMFASVPIRLQAVEVALMASFGLIAQAAIIYRIAQSLQGRRAGVGESLAVILMRPLPVLGLSLLLGGITFVEAVLPQQMSLMGSLALMVIQIIYCVAVPVVMVEHAGVKQALARSRYLTKLYRLRIFGVFFIVTMLGMFIPIAMLIITGTLFDNSWKFAVMLAISPLQAVMSMVVYQRLGQAKEGVDIAATSAIPEMRARVVPARSDAEDTSRM